MFNDEKSEQISHLGLKVGTEISKENDLVKIGNNETLKYDSYFGNKILIRINS